MKKTYEDVMELVGKVAEVSAENTQSTAIILAKLEQQGTLLTGLSKTVATVKDDVTTLSNDMEQLKLNEEVTTTQQETILEVAKKRICEIIGDDELEQKKYFKIFIQNLYKDTRENAGLGSKISRTRKGDFQRCIDYIEAWIPSCGCAKLRAKADRNAEVRRKARELGYE